MDDDLKKYSAHSELLFRESFDSADSLDLSDLPDLEIVPEEPEDSEDYNPSSEQRRGFLFLDYSRLLIPSSATVQGDRLCQGIFPSKLPCRFYDGATLFVGERATADIKRQIPSPIRKDGAK